MFFVFLCCLVSVNASAEKASDKTIFNANQLNSPKYSIGVPQGAASMYSVETKFPKANIKYFNSLHDGYLSVKHGRIDAFAFDRHSFQYIVTNNPELAVLDEKIDDEKITVGLAKKNSELFKKVNTFIKQYRQDGTYNEMYNRWINTTNPKMPDIPKPTNPTITLKIGTSGNDEPMSFFQDNRITGFDIEFAERLALYLNAKVIYEVIDYPAIINALLSGKIDLIIANLNYIPERAESINFSDTYIDTEIVFLVRKDRLPQTDKDLKDKAQKDWFEDILSGLKSSFYRNFIEEQRYKMILNGLGITLLITLSSAFFGSILAAIICTLRRYHNKYISNSAKSFIMAIQGTPIVVLLMILYYVVFNRFDTDALIVAIIGFSIDFSVYVAESMRASLDAIDKGQYEASHALGFNRIQTYLKIIIPQSAIQILPVYKGQFISMLKTTSIVGYIAVIDLTKASDIIRSRTFDAFFPLIATALIYFAIAYLSAYLLTKIEIKISPQTRQRVVKGL